MDTSNLDLIYDLSKNNFKKLKKRSGTPIIIDGTPIIIDDNGKEIHTKYRGSKTIDGNVWLFYGDLKHNPASFGAFNLTAIRKFGEGSLKVYKKK